MDETRIITTEGLTTCLDPGRGWTITSGGLNFLRKQECWEGHKQALMTTIRKETKRKEEWEDAGYSSPTWAVLRALQQFNSATRIEGEAAMSAPPFFQSAGRGDLLCVRCLLITESPKTPSHYRYQIWVLDNLGPWDEEIYSSGGKKNDQR